MSAKVTVVSTIAIQFSFTLAIGTLRECIPTPTLAVRLIAFGALQVVMALDDENHKRVPVANLAARFLSGNRLTILVLHLAWLKFHNDYECRCLLKKVKRYMLAKIVFRQMCF